MLEDPQVKARALFNWMAYPGSPAPVPVADTPVRLSETPGEIRHRAPTLGEHTDEILRGLKFGVEEIARLREAGVV